MRATTLLSGVLTAASCFFVFPATAQFENYVFGPDEYPPLPTVGFKFNHFSIIVGDLAASMHFYTTVLGMRELFTYHATDYFKLAYLGYPSGGHNGTGYQSPLEMLRDKNNMQGLVEFLYYAPNATDPSPKLPEASSKKTNTFSHMGLIVPDIKVARQRFLEYNVSIIADIGEVNPDPVKIHRALIAYGTGLLPEGSDKVVEEIMKSLGNSGQEAMIIEDPDGNIIEVQPQW